MRKFLAIYVFLMLFAHCGNSWSKKGHRVVGLIAERHLTNKAAKEISKLLGPYTIAEVSNYMDEIKSDPNYRHMNPWHYCTIPDGMTYEEAGTPEEGDAIVTIKRLISELKTKEFTDEDEAFALKCLIHLIGDVHQPLHVGNGNDRGGNDVILEYFWRQRNLHAVWDRWIIEEQNYSYTEYTDWIDHASISQIEKWQSEELLDWIYESRDYRAQVYEMPEDKKLSYKYNYANLELLNLRLLQAGIRLAGVLNEIYG